MEELGNSRFMAGWMACPNIAKIQVWGLFLEFCTHFWTLLCQGHQAKAIFPCETVHVRMNSGCFADWDVYCPYTDCSKSLWQAVFLNIDVYYHLKYMSKACVELNCMFNENPVIIKNAKAKGQDPGLIIWRKNSHFQREWWHSLISVPSNFQDEVCQNTVFETEETYYKS